MSKSELPTFSMGKGMGGSLPQRLTVEDGHGRGGENAATEEHLVRQLAALPAEQRERVLGDTGPPVGALSDKLNEYIDNTKEAEKRSAALQREFEQERSARIAAESALETLRDNVRDCGDRTVNGVLIYTDMARKLWAELEEKPDGEATR